MATLSASSIGPRTIANAQLERWQYIPADLRQRPQWCAADPDKRPLTPGGRAASSTDPNTWATFETACQYAKAEDLHIGYVLHESDPFTCIDLDVKDASTHPGKPHLWTTAEDIVLYQQIIDQLDTYTERSRSGKGLHLWVRADIGRGCKRGGVEVYSRERFVICTGDVWQDKPIADRRDILVNMVSQMRPFDTADERALLEIEPETDDWYVLQLAVTASNSEKFCTLWRGDWEALGYSSQSEADLALLSILAFYSASNEQVRRCFRDSKLGKRKKAQKDDRYLNLSLRKIRNRQSAEQRRVDAIKAQIPLLNAAAAVAERRDRQLFRFKQIGEGDIDISSTRPPTMDLGMMLESLVYVAAEKPLVVFRDMPTVRVPPSVMGSLLTHNRMEIVNKEGKDEKVPTFSVWLGCDRRIVVYTLTFDPRAGEFCRSPDQRPALNLWKPRPHNPPEDWPVRAHPFMEHVRYLIPVDAERERFLDWLAHIEQKPGELPHAHYLMIATQQGVGRNWLSSLMACVWSGHVALDYDLKGTFQNGFNGQLSRKLLAVVDEINEGGTGERWQHSEKLKSMVTTSERFINAKYGLQHSEVNCCRWLLFSNYESALPLHADDRRWNVIRNPTEPRNADYYVHLYRALADPKFISSVRELLRRRDISRFNPGARAVMNDAKESVVATSMTHEDEKAAELVASYPCDLILAEYLFWSIYDVNPNMSADASRLWKFLAPIAAKAKIERMPKPMTLFGKPKQKVWILRNTQRWKTASGTEIEQELARGWN
jgi:primase-polymerase (primpol)-like protein